MKTQKDEKIKTVLCAAVGTASHQHGLEAMYQVWQIWQCAEICESCTEPTCSK